MASGINQMFFKTLYSFDRYNSFYLMLQR